jgi:hypothetical protein
VTFCLFFPSVSRAYQFTLSGHFEAGSRSQAEDFEEEENDREYDFRNYHLKFKHRYSDRLTYDVSSFIYDKDYKSDGTLDSISRVFQAGGEYYLIKHKPESLKLNIKFKFRSKRFRDAPSDEFNQFSFSPGLTYSRKDTYRLQAAIGVNSYDYINSAGRGQLDLFSRLGAKRYLFNKRLVFNSSYRIETSLKKGSDRRRNKTGIMFGFDYVFDSPLIRKISSKAKFGQRDTKDDDTRDVDLDYTYREFHIRSEHRIAKSLLINVTYNYFRKNYLTAELDHNGFYLRNKWKYTLFSDDFRELYAAVSAEHKEVYYAILKENDYQKETLIITGTYKKKRDWKTSASLQGSFYDYAEPIKNRNRYYARLSLNKLFPQINVNVTLALKYKYTDNRHANDSEEESVRTAVIYKF